MPAPALQHLMFDIDGTLLESCVFDGQCFDEAVMAVTGIALHANRRLYKHVSDEGILRQHVQEHALAHGEEVISKIKRVFVENIRKHLEQQPAVEIAGAQHLLEQLRQEQNISLSLATGGWQETALLKLNSAGIDISDLALASSNDHYQRTEIMKLARQRAAIDSSVPITYVGDGAWDKQASDELSWNFILRGRALEHHQRLDDLRDVQRFMSFLF